MDDRKAFLIEMYRQMFSDINRHITIIWQSVSVVIGAFALFSFVEKEIIPIDIAVSLIIILCSWLYAHMIDAAYWYNRNLAIIGNIEKQFLKQSDLKDIQYYFGLHRSSKNRMITHLKIQSFLGISIAILVILFHFFNVTAPTTEAEEPFITTSKILPYLSGICGFIYCAILSRKRRSDYTEFIKNSPGVDVDTGGIEYRSGHPVDHQ